MQNHQKVTSVPKNFFLQGRIKSKYISYSTDVIIYLCLVSTPNVVECINRVHYKPKVTSSMYYYYDSYDFRKIRLQRRYDMNGRFQMQGEKSVFCRYPCKPVLLRLSLVGNLVPPWDRMEGTWLWTESCMQACRLGSRQAGS
jgi:hypothetical protein